MSHKIPIKDILYFESKKRKVYIVTEKNIFELYGKLNDIEKSLKNGKIVFLRIHQSFLVNYRHVDVLAYDFVIMDNGKQLSISEDRRKLTSEQYCAMEDTFMLSDDWAVWIVNILLAMFATHIFFFYFDIFFEKSKRSIGLLTGIVVFIFWQLSVPELVKALSVAQTIGVTVGVTLFSVVKIYDGKIWKKCFFVIIFDAVWMLMEMLVNDLLILYCERLAVSQSFGGVVSKLLFFAVIIALKKVFTNEEVKELPIEHNILLIFIPVGSIYIMNAVFTLAYSAGWKYVEMYSLVSVVILLLINILIFYIYIKLADDLQVKRMNAVYEQQLDLCERHQEETEISILQMRDIRHSMKNHLFRS